MYFSIVTRPRPMQSEVQNPTGTRSFLYFGPNVLSLKIQSRASDRCCGSFGGRWMFLLIFL